MVKSVAFLLLISVVSGCDQDDNGANVVPSPAPTHLAAVPEAPAAPEVEPTERLPWPVRGEPPVDIPGWQGKTKIKAPGSWKDSDGVVPGEAGLHHAYKDSRCTEADPAMQPIAEACYVFSRDNNGTPEQSPLWLIETNPAKDECHEHRGGEGHPDVFDCDAFCKGSADADRNAYSSGKCVKALAEGVWSARCECESAPAA